MSTGVTEVTGAVAVVRDFVNTSDHDEGTDELDSRAGLTTWLVTTGLVQPGPEATSAELDLALRLRDGLRRGLELNHDGGSETLPRLVEVLAELPVTLGWDGTAPVLTTTEGGVLGGLARVAVSAHETVATAEWGRLKICSFDECEWAYVDRSKNRSRHYCEYGCGNKLKTRAYRARQRAAL
jgi:predicted RNA-binding Zn ribbon-like protein